MASGVLDYFQIGDTCLLSLVEHCAWVRMACGLLCHGPPERTAIWWVCEYTPVPVSEDTMAENKQGRAVDRSGPSQEYYGRLHPINATP